MPLEPGQILAHYRIDRQIGEGGMGAVFLAVDTKLDRRVALKVLPQEMAADSDRLERFQREAKAVAALNHPHIVTLYSVEEESGTHFITMELVEGESLDRGLPPGGLRVAQVFDIGMALADALSAAHEKGIIHRDLKPANVMVTEEGRVKVLDFGLAKLGLSSSAGMPPVGSTEVSSAPTVMAPRDRTLTDAGLVVGTVPYMSPEQVGGEAVDARTDIFSLGVVLYELATGQRPFGGKNPAETISSIMRDAPRPVSEARQDMPRHLGRIIDHCLQKEPLDRFQTARDVYNELRALRKEVESGTSDVTGISSAPAQAAAPSSAPVNVASASSPASVLPSDPASATAHVAGSGIAPAAADAMASSAASDPGSGTRSSVSGISGVLPSPAERRPWFIGAVVGGVLVAVVLAAFWLGSRRGTDSSGDAAKTASEVAESEPIEEASAVASAEAELGSLAVLPFQNMSSDEEQEYFADGLSEELMSALAKVEGLRVAGRTSSFAFKGKQEELSVIGEKLGVAHILEGSVRKSGDAIRVNAQLVNAADGFQLWSETYDRTLDDIFAVQDDIATSVASALELTLLGGGQETSRPNAEAYDLVLQARFVMQRRSEETVARARGLIEDALEIDPDYAPAWAEMGLVHMREYELALEQDEQQEALQEARAALERALELDPDLAVAHSRMSAVYRRSRPSDLVAARRSMERALALDPEESVVLGNAANFYQSMGQFDKAIELNSQQLRTDPLNLLARANLAAQYLYSARWAEAEQNYRKLADLSPEFQAAHSGLAQALHEQGRSEEALQEIESESILSMKLTYKSEILAELGRRAEVEAVLEEIDRELPPDYGRWQRALVYTELGLDAEAETALDEVLEKDSSQYPSSVAQLYAVKGDADKAFEWLDKSLEMGEPLSGIAGDRYLRPLHSDPRWKPFLKKAGFPVD